MGWLSWIIVGLVAGALAQRATGVKGSGCLFTVVIGILGGLLGGFLANLAGDDGIGDFGLRSLLLAFVGAAVLLLVFGGRLRDGRLRGRRRG
jgi:uncharacterized membrane protein YeaQ/YmgE (transglycosylase-associated protein family)